MNRALLGSPGFRHAQASEADSGGQAALPHASHSGGAAARGAGSPSISDRWLYNDWALDSGASPERSERREIDACRQGVGALTSATGSPWPPPHVLRSLGRGDLRLDGPSGLAVISEELLGQMEWFLSGFQNYTFHSGRGHRPGVAPEDWEHVGI